MIPVRPKSPPREQVLRILARNLNNKMTQFGNKKLRTENEVSDFII